MGAAGVGVRGLLGVGGAAGGELLPDLTGKLEKEDDALRVKELWSNDRANKILLAKWNCLHRQKLLVVLNSFLS